MTLKPAHNGLTVTGQFQCAEGRLRAFSCLIVAIRFHRVGLSKLKTCCHKRLGPALASYFLSPSLVAAGPAIAFLSRVRWAEYDEGVAGIESSRRPLSASPSCLDHVCTSQGRQSS